MRTITCRFALAALASLFVAGVARADGYLQTNLVADQTGMGAQVVDPDLLNPWGMSFSSGSPLWVSNQVAGPRPVGPDSATSTIYIIPGGAGHDGLSVTKAGLTVNIPNDGGLPPNVDTNGPTGQVNTSAPGITTSTSDFKVNGTHAAFIFANLDGSISAWAGGASSTVTVHATATNTPSYTGLAIGNATIGGTPGAFIYAADQNSKNVDMFDSNWNLKAHLVDPNLPSGLTAFNVQNIKGILYVTYANPNNPLGGVVDEFNTDGTFIKRLITDTAGTNLQTPWGVAIAPDHWGAFGGDLLVGNNDGDGTINAFSLTDGSFKGQLKLAHGISFSQGELWGLSFGNGDSAGASNVLYFAAGLPGAQHGLVGALSVPEPGSAVLGLIAVGTLTAGWRWKNRRRAATS